MKIMWYNTFYLGEGVAYSMTLSQLGRRGRGMEIGVVVKQRACNHGSTSSIPGLGLKFFTLLTRQYKTNEPLK